jgi:hypothetical protein
MNIVLPVLLIIGAFILTLWFAGWKTKRACNFILEDLQAKKAFDPESAVDLPYSRAAMFHFGMRDYRPKALGALVKFDHVRMQEEGRYYLRDGHKLHGPS